MKTTEKKKLNARQERFCEFVAAGETQEAAHKKAGYKCSANSARAAASIMANRPEIKARISELKQKQPDLLEARLTKEEKLKVLARLIRTPDNSEVVKVADKLRAIELHSKLMGHFEPDRMELELGNTTLQTIKERAKEVGYTLSMRYAQPSSMPPRSNHLS
jgi:phage terminase small subunit